MFYYLFFYIIIFPLQGTNGNGKQQKIYQNQLQLSIKADKEVYNFETFAYDSYGYLRLHGKWTGDKARFANLFFKEKLALKCQQENSEKGIYFDIVFCVTDCVKKNNDLKDTKCKECTKGIKLCYESELSAGKVKNSKHEMKKVKDEIDCKDENLHGLQVSAVNNATFGKIDFTLKSSIDTNSYEFSINGTENCFKIRVGTEAALTTQITDLYDKKLSVSPPLKDIGKSRKWLDDGWANSNENFHLFALDFIPAKKKYQLNAGDYFKSLSYFGGGDQCNMYLKFAGNFVHTCKIDWQIIQPENKEGCDLHCGPKKGNSKIKKMALFNVTNSRKYKANKLLCIFKIDETNIKNYTYIRRDKESSGEWRSDETFPSYFQLHLETTYKGIPLKFLDIEAYTKQIETFKKDHTEEKVFQSSKFEATSTSRNYIFELAEGEKIVVSQLLLVCNGWTITTPHVVTKIGKSC